MEFNKMNWFLKPSPAGEGGVRRNINSFLLQYSLVNLRYNFFSSPKPSPSREGLRARHSNLKSHT